MDTVTNKAKLQLLFNKYKYVALVLALGIVLMLLPSGKTEDKDTAEVTTNSIEPATDKKLADVLSAMHGVGEVKVLLSVASGEERIYQVDEDRSESSGDIRSTTVITADSSKNQQGLIKQIVPPTYLGAVIVCEGGGDPVVRLAIVDAVSKFTGLTTDKISVIKMK